uniref:Uncharacterized protein n=1 Tax=Anopheles farauti TaxID=69004 RepID=A0A182PZT1_9DIPT
MGFRSMTTLFPYPVPPPVLIGGPLAESVGGGRVCNAIFGGGTNVNGGTSNGAMRGEDEPSSSPGTSGSGSISVTSAGTGFFSSRSTVGSGGGGGGGGGSAPRIVCGTTMGEPARNRAAFDVPAAIPPNVLMSRLKPNDIFPCGCNSSSPPNEVISSPRIVAISPCMNAHGIVELASGHFSPLGQYTSAPEPCENNGILSWHKVHFSVGFGAGAGAGPPVPGGALLGAVPGGGGSPPGPPLPGPLAPGPPGAPLLGAPPLPGGAGLAFGPTPGLLPGLGPSPGGTPSGGPPCDWPCDWGGGGGPCWESC